MHRINTAAGFIKQNMPLGKGGSLTDAQAWMYAYINSQSGLRIRVWWTTRLKNPQEIPCEGDGVNLYGEPVNGVILGQGIK